MKKTLGFGVISVIVGLVLFAFVAGDCFNLVFNKISIEDKGYGEFENGNICEGELKYVLSGLGSAEKSKKIFFIPVGNADAKLYLISGNGGYVTIEASEDTDKLDELTESTKAYLSGKTNEPGTGLRFLARAEEINDEQLAMLKAHFDSQNIDVSEWEMKVSSMVLVQLDITAVIIELSVSFGLILIGVILIIISRRGQYGETVFVGEMTPEEEARQAEYLSGKVDHIRAKAAEDAAKKKARQKKEKAKR